MKPTTLAEIKRQLRKFNRQFALVVNFWTTPHFKTIEILIQNMGFDSSDCVDHNHQQSVDRLYQGLEVLKGFSTYYNSHVEKWVHSECSMIIEGNVQNEEYQ